MPGTLIDPRDALSEFVVSPPAGATFALPPVGVPDSFRSRVLENLERAEWQKYYSLPPELAEAAVLGDASSANSSISFFRGAEGALLALALQLRPAQIWIPQDSYPGYARVARAIGATLLEYSEAGTPRPHSSDQEAWFIVTAPGNPRDNMVNRSEWGRWRNSSPRLIVDATYEMPGTIRFRELVDLALDAGAHLVFSFSKALPLASLRLGGCIAPSEYAPPATTHHHWSILDVATVAALTDASSWDSLIAHREAQLDIHRRFVRELEERGHEVVGRESGVFATAMQHAALAGLTGKRYRSGIIRLESSSGNLDRLMNSEVSALD